MTLNCYTFKKLRSVAAVDSVPTANSVASDTAVKALSFNKILGHKPILLASFTGGTKTATIQVFCRDTVRDFADPTKDNIPVLSCVASISLTTAVTRMPIDCVGYGSEIFIAVSALGSSTTLDLYMADGLSNY